MRKIVLAAMFAVIVAPHAWAQDREIARFSGSGVMSTRPFTVTGPWEVQFQSKDFFSAELMNADGSDVELVANQMGGSGSFYSPTPGTYYLKTNAMGAWQMRVVVVNGGGQPGD